MRIAVVADFSIINVNYRSRPLGELRERGHQVSLFDSRSNFDGELLHGFDVVHFHRFVDMTARRAMQGLRDDGIGVVWDDDDNLALVLAHDPETARKARYDSRERHRDVARTIKLADVVTTTSEPLADYYRRSGAARVEIIENFLPPTYTTSIPPTRIDGVVVGWIGGAEHQPDVARLDLGGIVARLLERHPRLYVATVGVDLGIRSDRCERHPPVSYPELGHQVAEFDVGLAPLADEAFNRSRSDVKLKEYAYARVPWLASPVGPYLGLGEREGGLLVPDDGWEAAVEQLVVDDYRRRILALRGRRWAETKTAVNNLRAWEAVLDEAHARGQARGRTAAAPAP